MPMTASTNASRPNPESSDAAKGSCESARSRCAPCLKMAVLAPMPATA
jgi:hypothetical protein